MALLSIAAISTRRRCTASGFTASDISPADTLNDVSLGTAALVVAGILFQSGRPAGVQRANSFAARRPRSLGRATGDDWIGFHRHQRIDGPGGRIPGRFRVTQAHYRYQRV